MRVPTRHSGIAADLEPTAYRGTTPCPAHTRAPSNRLFRDGTAGGACPFAVEGRLSGDPEQAPRSVPPVLHRAAG